MKWITFIAIFYSVLQSFSQTYYVAVNGSNTTGSGTSANPWASITYALDQVSDGSLILVKPGTYTGQVNMRGSFALGVEVRSEVPYQAVMRNNDRVFTFYKDNRGCHGITLSGFDIAHSAAGAQALVVHIDGGGDGSVHDIVLENNILHDSYNNDLLKINNSCYDITITGNMFYNQSGSDEHIDINSAQNVFIRKNIFFNDFAGSGRTNGNNTSSYIVIKDSNGSDDQYLGSSNVMVQKNIFFNWEGSTGSNFILCGEDGHPHFEAIGILIENNLLLGNSANVMRAPFGVKGCKDVTFRNNTIVGDLPSSAFTFRLNTEGANMSNENIQFYNNIWSDPTGTMGSDGSSNNDFSDTPIGQTTSWILNNNLYWNGGSAIPQDNNDLINFTNDLNSVLQDPVVATNMITIPRWNASTNLFDDGSTIISQAFADLVECCGQLGDYSAAINNAHPAFSPDEDILDNIRTTPDLGAVEQNELCPNVLENNWIGTSGQWYGSVNNWSQGRWPEPCDAVTFPNSILVTINAGDTARAFSILIPQTTRLQVNLSAVLKVQVAE